MSDQMGRRGNPRRQCSTQLGRANLRDRFFDLAWLDWPYDALREVLGDLWLLPTAEILARYNG